MNRPLEEKAVRSQRSGEAAHRPGPRATDGSDRAGIDLTFRRSALGLVLIARTASGLRAVLLGDEEDELLRDLGRRFPAAAIQRDGDGLAEVAAAVLRVLAAPGERFDLPLDPGGTAFQRAVWGALREIPAGRTATYAEIAARIGRPTAARAVAAACGANPLAVVVPCHRILRGDGGISGYRWGVDRKRRLLEMESVPVRGRADGS